MGEIIDVVARKEEQLSQQVNIDDISEEDLKEEIEALQEKIRLMYLKYGLKISITTDKSDKILNISSDNSIEK